MAGEEAGLALVADEDHHYEVGVGHRDGRRVALVRLRIGDATEVVAQRPASGSNHRVEIIADEETYRFCYGGDPTTELGTAATRYLATEVTGSFTGVYVGPYATSDAVNPTPARFKRFVYERTG